MAVVCCAWSGAAAGGGGRAAPPYTAEVPVDMMALHAYASGLAQVGLHEGCGLMVLEGGANSAVKLLLRISEDCADPASTICRDQSTRTLW